ncbi:MAG: archease [Candidatus Diapherotrites archaeon]|nr:archease [Candidatus Diapherotrites archaeon]
MSYKFLEDEATADIAFEVSANSLKELFEDSARAVFEVMVETKTVKPKIKKKISLKTETPEKLLYDLLSEIVFLKDKYGMVFCSAKIKLTEGKNSLNLSAEFFGDKADPNTQKLGQDIKAVTLHKFFVRKEKNKWKAFVLLDI